MTEYKQGIIGVGAKNEQKSRCKTSKKQVVMRGSVCATIWYKPTDNNGKYIHEGRMNMDENKKKFALWIHPSALEKAERLYQLDNCRSKSEFIEKAIIFYSGYISAEDSRDYLPEVIVSTLQGSLNTFENRMASLLFKYAVELDMMMHISAANFHIDENTLSRLRGKCVKEVKALYGRISFEDAVNYQKGK